MNQTNVSHQVLERLTEEWDALTPEAQKAAKYVLENPNDVGVSTDIQNPISSFFAITGSSIVNNVASIDLAFSAVEFNQGFWVPVQGQKTIHLVITVV